MKLEVLESFIKVQAEMLWSLFDEIQKIKKAGNKKKKRRKKHERISADL